MLLCPPILSIDETHLFFYVFFFCLLPLLGGFSRLCSARVWCIEDIKLCLTLLPVEHQFLTSKQVEIERFYFFSGVISMLFFFSSSVSVSSSSLHRFHSIRLFYTILLIYFLYPCALSFLLSSIHFHLTFVFTLFIEFFNILKV